MKKIKGLTILLVGICLLNISCLSNSQEKDKKDKLKLDIEIDVPYILRILAKNSPDEQFNQALEITIKENKRENQKDFVSLFVEKYDSIDNSSKLAYIFFNESYDKIKLTDSNNLVKEALQEVLKNLLDKSYHIFENRITKYGIQKPEKLIREIPERISIELVGIENSQSLQPFLLKNISIQIWRMYKTNEILSFLHSMNQKIEYMLEKKQSEDRLFAPKSYKFDKPFLEYLNTKERDVHTVGLVNSSDTAAVNEILKLSKDVYPSDITFVWSHNSTDSADLKLYALRGTGAKRNSIIDGDEIVSFEIDHGFFSKENCSVNITLNNFGSRYLSGITETEIGNAIAVVIENQVYSIIMINERIENGKILMTGNFSFEELKPFSIISNSDHMPVDLFILNENIRTDSIRQ